MIVRSVTLLAVVLVVCAFAGTVEAAGELKPVLVYPAPMSIERAGGALEVDKTARIVVPGGTRRRGRGPTPSASLPG